MLTYVLTYVLTHVLANVSALAYVLTSNTMLAIHRLRQYVQ